MKSCLWLEQLARVYPKTQLCRATTLRSQFPKTFASKSQYGASDKSYKLPSANLDHNVTEEEKAQFEAELEKNRSKKIRTPWHHEGADTPPAERKDSSKTLTKGKLLTTPSRLLKLILPLKPYDQLHSDSSDASPLALLVHPQQPLSYLERLIQAELPPLKDGDKERMPTITFAAQGSSSSSDHNPPASKSRASKDPDPDSESSSDSVKAAKRDEEQADSAARRPAGRRVETYSGLGREARDSDTEGDSGSGSGDGDAFVRWSKSTEMGDFIRDAARGKEFAVQIEGAPAELRVEVPSFGDRTYYLRLRLRKRAREIAGMADVKKECDILAHRGAQRLAMGGLGGLLGWSAVVGWLTFKTKLGWEVMEPVTYLVGLVGIILGYSWFLWHNREVSYRSAMNLTVSTRQNKLYQSKGFDLHRWQMAIDDANALRREIIAVANEYDVDWDEKEDTQYDKVIDALKEGRKGKSGKGKGKSEKEDDDDDGDD